MVFVVPSGENFGQRDIDLLTQMKECGFIVYRDKPFRLKSGIESNVYVFGREDITDNPFFEWLIGEKIISSLHNRSGEKRIKCLIGIPTAGTVLAQAVAMVAWRTRNLQPTCHRVMREMKKAHGAHQTWVNGKPDHSRHLYWLVDNVITDGQSKIEAREKLIEDGYETEELGVLVFVDRQQGGVKRLEQEGFKKIITIYNLLDLTFAFGELGMWPKNAVASVEAEIRTHQLS